MGVNIKVGFQVDDKQVANSLAGIKNDIQNAFNTNIRMSDQISQAVVEAKALEKAMKRATTDKGISYYSLQAELRKCGTSAAQLTTNLAMGGEQFRASLNAANVALATSNRTVISLNSQIKEMARVMLQSFKFTAAQTVIRNITKMCQQAVGWVKELNKAVNAIGVVTGKSEAQLAKVTEDAIQGAKNLRIAADEYAKAALIFYQQGLGDEEVALRTEITIKAAKAAGVAVDEMSQQLTAIWNTYGMIGEEQARAASVGAKLAASTAADFADIAEAMQTSASAASQMGVSYNSLASIIATVKDTTQLSASTIGNAYKTIFSRFEQLKSAGTDGEVTLNRVSQQLDELGVHVLDSSGELRELDDVIMELGTGWDNYTQKQKLAIAETVGGTRQYGQFLALMQNFDKYQENLNIANSETGADTLEQQYSQAMESVTEKANRASESWKRAFGEIITEDQLKGVYNVSNDIAGVVETIFKGMGGLPGILATVAAVLSSKIGPAVSNIASNIGVGAASFFGGQKGRSKMIDRDYDKQTAANESMKQGASASEVESLNIQKQKLEVSRETAHVINQIDTLEKSASGAYKIKLDSLREQTEKKLEIYQTTLDEVAAMKQQTAENEKLLQQEERRLADERLALELRVQEAQQASSDAYANRKSIGNQITAKTQELEDAKLNQATDPNAANAKANQAEVDRLTAELEELKVAWSDADAAAKQASADFQEAKRVLADFDKASGGVNKTSQEFTKLIEKVRDFSVTGEGNVETVSAEMTKMGLACGLPADKLTELQSKLDQVGTEDSIQKQQEYCQAYLQAIKDTLEQMGLLDDKTNKLAQDVIDKTQKMGEARNGIGSTGERAKQKPDQNSPKQKEKIDVSGAIGGMAQVATAAVTATMAVKNLWTTMSNPDASIGEKLTSLGQSVIMLVPTFKSASAGVKALSAAIHASVPVVLAVIAAIAALIAIISFLYSEWKNKQPEARLKAMQAAAEGLTEAEEEAKKAADNLRASFDKYESAKKKLDDCKRGTEEWTAALKEANDAALEVLDNLPSNMSAEEIRGLYKQENGVLTLDEEGIKKVQKALDTEAAKAGYAASMGGVNVSRATIDLERSEVAKDVSNVTGYGSSYIDSILEKNLDELSTIIDESEFRDKLSELGVNVGALSSNQIAELQNSFQGLASKSDAVNARFDVLSRLKADEILGDDYNDAEKNYASEQLQAETDAIYDKVLGSLTNGRFGSSEEAWKYGDISKGQTEINADLVARFNEATGNNWTSSQNGVQGTDTSRFFEFLDDQGELHKLSAEQVAQQIAASEALAKLGESADAAREALANLKDNEVLQNATTAFLANGNMNSIKKSDLESINNEESWNQLSPELQSAYRSFEDYQKAITSSMTAIGEAAKNSRVAVQDAYKSMNLGDISADTADIVVEALDKSMAIAGKDGMNSVKTVIESLGEDGAEEFKEIYDAIDWTKPNVEELTEKLRNQGIEATAAAAMAEQLAKALKEQTEATLESVQAEYAAAKKIVGDIDDYDIVNAEDIQKLQDMGIATDIYFQEMADGTFMLTEDASQFRDIVNGIELGKMQEVVAGLENKYQTLSKLADGASSWNISGDEKIKMLQESFGDNADVQEAIKNYQNAYDANTSSYADKSTRENYATAVNNLDEVFNANFTTDRINNELKETVAELDKAQKMIKEAEFQNDVQKYGLDLKETTQYAKSLAKEMGISEDQAKDLAIANQRLDRGLLDLNKNLKDYKKALDKGNKGSAEYAKTMIAVKKSLADVLNVADGDMLSDQFVEDTLASEDLTKALDGDVEAIKRLQTAAADDIMINIVANQSEDPEDIKSRWEALKLAFESTDITAPTVDQTELLNSFNEMIKAGNMTKEQIEAALAGLHVSANVKTNYVTQTQQIPLTVTETSWLPNGTMTVPVPDGEGGTKNETYTSMRRITKTYDAGTSETETVVPQYEIEGTEGEGGVTTAFTPAPPVTPSKSSTTSGMHTGGGGGSKSAPKKFEKGEYHKRYTDTKKKLDSVSKSIEKYNSAADDSVGLRKLSNMQKANALLAKQGQLYNKLYQEALAYAKADKIKMQKSLSSLGITLKFNEDDTIANMEEIQKKWDEMLDATDLNGNGLLDKSEEELYKKTKENIEEQQKQIDKYIESVDEMNQAMEDAVNNIREYMNQKAEIINVKLETNLDPLERDIKALELTTELLGKLGVTTSKTIKLIGEQVDKTFSSYKEYSTGAVSTMAEIDKIQKSLTDPKVMSDYIDKFGPGAWDRYLKENSGIPAELLDQLKEYTDSIGDQISDLNGELDDLYSTYAEMFEDFLSRFDEINARIELNAEKLELYEKIYEASGDKSTDRKAIEASIASAKRNNKEAAYQTAQNKRDTLKEQLARDEKALADFQKQYGTDTSKYDEASAAWYNHLKEMVDNTKEGLQDAESEVVSTLSDVLDAAVEEAEKKTELARAKFVESITNGMFNDIEMMSTYYDDLEQKRKFYVDDYDKDYYLDKFDYQIDDYLKDANIVDPSRMAEWEKFQQRINDLRAEGVELTQAQIDKLQAEFELQKLYDQYEEAQNAKTTMRLTRDASGNYNYVYSSDSTAEDAADIAQKIKDKEKEIRDMGKSIIEEMSNTYLETSKELEAYLAENGGIADEHAMMLKERLDMMAAQIKQQCNETGIKFTETSLGIISDTEDMDACHQKFTESFITLETAEKEANTEKAKVISDNCDDIGIDYNDLSDDISDATQSIISDDRDAALAAINLKTETSAAMASAAASVTSASQKICSDIRSMIQEYQNLIDKIKEYEALAGQEVSTYDENTDYSSYLYNKWLDFNGSFGEFAEKYRDEINERMMAGAARGVDAGQNFTDAVNKLAEAFEKFGGKNGTAFDNWNYGGGTSNKTASGGLIKTPQVRSLAEEGPELVLNATDTQNILDAVKEVRSTVISRQIALKEAPIPVTTQPQSKETTPVLQDVKIDATFPNVSVADEIEEAFEDLINKTSQYVTKK